MQWGMLISGVRDTWEEGREGRGQKRGWSAGGEWGKVAGSAGNIREDGCSPEGQADEK